MSKTLSEKQEVSVRWIALVHRDDSRWSGGAFGAMQGKNDRFSALSKVVPTTHQGTCDNETLEAV